MGHLPHGGAWNPSWYAPRPSRGRPPPRSRRARECPTRITTRASSPSSCPVPSLRSRSSRTGSSSRGCGATPSTRCARTSRAFRRPSPTRSSPATAGPATSCSTRSRGRGTAPLQALAEGRIGVGQRPQPARPGPDRGQGRARAARRDAHPRRRPPSRLERRRRRLARPRRAGRGPSRPPVGLRAQGRLGWGARRAPRGRPRRGGPRLPPADARPAAARAVTAEPRRPGRPVPRGRARGHAPRQDPVLPVDDHAQHVLDGAALRPRLRGGQWLRAAREGRVRRADGQARPALPAAAPRRRGHRARGRRADGRPTGPCRPEGPRPARPRPARRSPPRPTSGSSSTATTTGSGRGCSGSTPAPSTRSWTTPTTASPWIAFMREVLADLRPALTDDGIAVLVIGDVEMDRGKPSTAGHALAERVWEEAALPAGYRLAGLVRDEVAANRKMTRLWGDEAGRATKTDRILVLGATEAGPPPGARLGRPPARLDLAADPVARPVTSGPGFGGSMERARVPRRATITASADDLPDPRRDPRHGARAPDHLPRRGAAVLLALLVLALGSIPALAVDELPRLQTAVTDQADVLSDADVATIEQALDALDGLRQHPAVRRVRRLDRRRGRRPRSPRARPRRHRWAATTRCSLVAVEDRSDALWVGDALGEVTDDEIDAILGEHVEPDLADGDYAGAAVAGAEALGDGVHGLDPADGPARRRDGAARRRGLGRDRGAVRRRVQPHADPRAAAARRRRDPRRAGAARPAARRTKERGRRPREAQPGRQPGAARRRRGAQGRRQRRRVRGGPVGRGRGHRLPATRSPTPRASCGPRSRSGSAWTTPSRSPRPSRSGCSRRSSRARRAPRRCSTSRSSASTSCATSRRPRRPSSRRSARSSRRSAAAPRGRRDRVRPDRRSPTRHRP